MPQAWRQAIVSLGVGCTQDNLQASPDPGMVRVGIRLEALAKLEIECTLRNRFNMNMIKSEAVRLRLQENVEALDSAMWSPDAHAHAAWIVSAL